MQRRPEKAKTEEYIMDLSGLNPQQREAASTLKGPLLILAGAGSGKTRTITMRMAHMIDDQKIPADQILAITFTNKAAREMAERVGKFLWGKQKPTIGTFHYLGLNILKEDIDKLGYQKNFTLYDRSDQLSLVREALKYLKNGKAFDKQTLLSMIGDMKNKNMSLDAYLNSPFISLEDDYGIALDHVYRFMKEKMEYFNAIDFDDILLLVCELFDKYPEVAEKYSKKYQYLMVDEYQDTNPLQFKMIRGLTSTHNNICVVGDDDQSIYGFRGADIKNILNFEKQFQNTKVIKLEENYRSTAAILDLANAIIKENKNRKEKAMWTSGEKGELPFLWVTGDATHEAQIVCDKVVKLRNEGQSLKEMAILYRSNTQTPPFEDQLRLNQIPYRILGGQKLYERKEVKDIIAYLSTIQNPFNDISVRRILNVPARGIGPKTLKKYLDISEKANTNLYKAMNKEAYTQGDMKVSAFLEMIQGLKKNFKEMSLSQAIQEVITQTKYESYIEQLYEGTKQVDMRKNSLNLLLESAKRFENQTNIPPTLKNFLEFILLVDNQDSKDEKENKNEITLMTLHSSKGLEFDNVFLVGVEEELLPHKKTITQNEDISEERRLCYVGITRARKNLIMTYCKERKLYNKNSKRAPSRFLLEHKELYTEQDRTGFGHMTVEEADEYKAQIFSDILNSLD